MNVQIRDHITCCWWERVSGIGSSKTTGESDGENEDTSGLSWVIPVPSACTDTMQYSAKVCDLFIFLETNYHLPLRIRKTIN